MLMKLRKGLILLSVKYKHYIISIIFLESDFKPSNREYKQNYTVPKYRKYIFHILV